MHFEKIKTAVARRFAAMSTHELFCTAVDGDVMWDRYLTSFPPGSNPMFRERTEHDCSCCRRFIRAVGNTVAIIDGKMESIWDVAVDDPTYQAVADAMAALVKSQPIQNRFLTTERTAGVDRNFDDKMGKVKTWEHFFVNIPTGQRGTKNFVRPNKDIGTELADSLARHDVFLRGLKEISHDAIDTVLELIGQNSLYRGEEHKHDILGFQTAKKEFDKLVESDRDNFRDNFVWLHAGILPASVSRIRNTSIGTLLLDLSANDCDMEGAVAKFETMKAGPNYKRPTALVTPSMVQKAKETVRSLGLDLERRYATLTDISINEIMFADRDAKKAIAGDVFDEIAGAVSVNKKTLDKVEDVTIENFLANILPKASSVELLVENRLVNNFVSLIAPVDPTALPLFKWDNNFSWTYNGDFADSLIKERVKKAGGNVAGELCCRLGWFNHDDLDFHLVEPRGGSEISFHNKISRSGGRLDVDMNAGYGKTREPVENIFYGSVENMLEGTYKLYVHSYYQRETTEVGFEAEIDFRGTVYRFAYDRPLRTGNKVVVAEFTYTKKDGVKIVTSLPMATVSKKVWNIDTETFQKVNVAMLSPNYWGERGVGNKHYFFMLDGCRLEGTARGFYNEFLRGDLDKHRKVLEIVGSKMRTDESVNQLSGLGFSSTQRNHVIARVKGAFTRTVRVTF